MNLVCKVLAQAALTTSNATLYTVPTGTTAIIKTLSICNTSTEDTTVNLWAIATTDVSDVKNKILHNLLVLAGETAFVNPDHYLSAGYKLSMSASTAAVIGVTITGVEM